MGASGATLKESGKHPVMSAQAVEKPIFRCRRWEGVIDLMLRNEVHWKVISKFITKIVNVKE